MKKSFLLIATVFLMVTARAETAVEKIYNSNTSPAEKLKKITAIKEFTIDERFAVDRILYEAGKNSAVQKTIYRYEALPMEMRSQLEVQFPGMQQWISQIAEKENKTIFLFDKDLANPITFKDFTLFEENKIQEPQKSIDLIRYLTKKNQYEIFLSQNLSVGPSYDRIVNLFSSLDEDEKQILHDEGFFAFWAGQQEIVTHKQKNKNCLCGGKPVVFTAFPMCTEKKQFPAFSDHVVPDKFAVALQRLQAGDLTIIEKMKIEKLNTWGSVYQDIVKQLSFLQLAVLDEVIVDRTMKISLVSMYDDLQKKGSSKYVENLGLDRFALQQLEAYYACVLGMLRVSSGQDRTLKTTETTHPMQWSQPGDIATVQKIESLPFLEYRKKIYTAYTLDSAVRFFLIQEIENREEELAGTCLETKALNDSTYEIVLKSCDSTNRIFAVKQTVNQVIGNFFRLCSNIVISELERDPDDKKQYSVIVIATADDIPYKYNDLLATKRAEFVRKNLGKKTATAESVTLEPVTGLPKGMRFAGLRFILKKPQT